MTGILAFGEVICASDGDRLAYKISPQANRKNLILIIVDALRPDNLSVYGYQRDTTPNLNSLQQSGIMRRVSDIRSSCSESSCGLLSIASSKFIHQFSNRPFTVQQARKLHGYRIYMILGGDHTNFYALKERFGDVDSYFDGAQAHGYFRNDDLLVVDQARLLAPSDGASVVIQFHLMSAHVLGKRHKGSIRYLPWVSYSRPRFGSARPPERAVNFYDNGDVQTDIVIRDLLAILNDKGYLDNTLGVIIADYGQSLGDHGMFSQASRKPRTIFFQSIRRSR